MVHLPDFSSYHPIFDAVELGDGAEVRKLLDADERLARIRDPESGQEPLHLAARGNQTEIAQLLFDRGADVNVVAANGDTPLHCTMYNEAVDVAGLLIANGAECERLNASGLTPLLGAVLYHHLSLARLLLQAGATLDLHSAVCLAKTEDVERLLNSDPKAIENAMWPRRMVFSAIAAIEYEWSEIVKDDYALLNDDKYEFVLAKYRPAIELLMRKRSAWYDDLGSGTPLTCAIGHMTLHVALVKAFLEMGVDPNRPDPQGLTPLALAVERGYPGIYERLVQYGAIR